MLRAVVPGAILVMVPKCPVCLAGWIAVTTGWGVPVAAVAHLRWLCVLFLLAVAVRLIVARVGREAYPTKLPRCCE